MSDDFYDTDGTDLEHTEANVNDIEWLMQNEPNELGEGGPAIVFDVPDDLNYNGQDIEYVLWTGSGILIWYDPDDWDRDYLFLHAEGRDGTIVVTRYEAGLLSAHEAFEKRASAPHAESLRPIYQWLLDEGVEFEDYDQ
jgi:hypothetical protein